MHFRLALHLRHCKQSIAMAKRICGHISIFEFYSNRSISIAYYKICRSFVLRYHYLKSQFSKKTFLSFDRMITRKMRIDFRKLNRISSNVNHTLMLNRCNAVALTAHRTAANFTATLNDMQQLTRKFTRALH